MPFLDANALTDDPDGLAFLADVLGTAENPPATPTKGLSVDSASQAGSWVSRGGSRASTTQPFADSSVSEMA